MYHIGISLDRDLFHNWIAEAETKVVCRAKNKNDLLKAVKIAEELGWIIGLSMMLVEQSQNAKARKGL